MSSRTKRTIVAILSVAFALRLGYLLHVTSAPGFVLDDPDSYLAGARALAGTQTGSGWRFSFDAVEHAVEGRVYALPPLYPTFLSFFALLPGFPFNAQLAQAVLATVAVGLVFLMGRRIHSDAAGLVAAGLAAVWLPNVIAVWSTMQEALYVPLALAAFVLLLRGADRDAGFWPLALAGMILGLAALTRSMPLYFVPVAALLLWLRSRRAGAAALVAGFASVTVPYSVALSIHLGEPTFIENHGGLRIAARHGDAASDRPPGLVRTAATLLRAFGESPMELLSEWSGTARSILHVHGGRLLQIYLGASTKAGATASKIAAHLFADAVFVLALVLAPVGAALCRRADLGGYLLLWIAIHLGLTTLAGFGGPRLRAPFEPHLLVLAAVPLTGRLVARRGPLAVALVASALAAAVTVPQIPASLGAKGEYGVYWPLERLPKRSAMPGRAGINALAVGGAIELTVRPRNPVGPTLVTLSVEGAPIETVRVEREHRFHVPWPRVELVHIELDARDRTTGRPVRTLVILPAR